MEEDIDIEESLLLEAAEKADQLVEHTQPQAKHLECLSTRFGHNRFRSMQWDIIRSVMQDKRDNCVIMPTGYGKSLCFQFPSVYKNGITLVVSPLISLMQDQVFALQVANIPATFVGSAQTDRTIESRIVNGEFRLVYASPEYLCGNIGQELLSKLHDKLTLIAVDEAHCVSHWGHDFRADYRKLGRLRAAVPDVPVLAVTATATPDVRDDICRQLRMHNPQVLCMGFDRPNLEFQVYAKTDDVWNDLKPFLTNVRGSTIIYVIRKADAEEIAALLQKHGVACEYYHAGATTKRRKDILESFTSDRLQVIVATVAFGMGIDKPDVRRVIHYGPSKNLETYYQEVGRAGRDGFPAKVIMFYKNADFSLIEWLLNQNVEHKSNEVVGHLREIAKHMREFIMTRQCRRVFLLAYFQSSTSHLTPRPDCCDNCRIGNSSIRLDEAYEGVSADGHCDLTDDTLLLLQAMQLTNSVTLAPLLLNGSGDKKLDTFRRHELFGKGKLKQKNYWPTLVKQLKNDKLLEMKKLPAPYYAKMIISSLGYAWLAKMPKQRLVLKAIGEMHDFFRKKRTTIMNSDMNVIGKGPVTGPKTIVNPIKAAANARQLEDVLLSVRSELALHTDYKPHMIASNAAIADMVKIRPTTIHEFKAALIEGFSLGKIEKFASYFFRTIAKFEANEFSMETLLQRNPPANCSDITANEAHRNLIDSLRTKKTATELRAQLNVTPEQLVNLFISAIKLGLNVTRDHLSSVFDCDDSHVEFIKSNMNGNETLDSIKRKCMQDGSVTEDEIKLVVAFVRVREHLNALNVPFYDATAGQLINAHLMVRRSDGGGRTSTVTTTTVDLCDRPAADEHALDEYDDSFDDVLGTLCDEHSTQPTISVDKTPVIALKSFVAKPPAQITTNGQSTRSEVSSVASISSGAAPPRAISSSVNMAPIDPPLKRVNIKAKSRVVYNDIDSDSDDAEEVKGSQSDAKRALPGWLSKSTISSKPTNAKRLKRL